MIVEKQSGSVFSVGKYDNSGDYADFYLPPYAGRTRDLVWYNQPSNWTPAESMYQGIDADVYDHRVVDHLAYSLNNQLGYWGSRIPGSVHNYVRTTADVSYNVGLSRPRMVTNMGGLHYGFLDVSQVVHNLFFPTSVPVLGPSTDRSYTYYPCPLMFSIYPELGLDHIKNQVLERLKDCSVDIGTNLATADQSVDLVEQIVNLFLKMLRSKGVSVWSKSSTAERDAALGIVTITSSAWLAFSYGIKPLVTDLYSLITGIETGRFNYISSKKVTAKTRRNSGLVTGTIYFPYCAPYSPVSSYDPYVTYTSDRGSFTFGDSRTASAAHKSYPFSITSELDVKAEYFFNLDRKHLLTTLGLTNPASWVWERLPYSFVLDWFIKVGSYLSLLDSQYGTERVAFNSIVKSYQQVKVDGITRNGSYWGRLCSQDTHYSDVSFDYLAIHNSLDSLVPTPELGTGVSFGKVNPRAANAISLLLQKLPSFLNIK